MTCTTHHHACDCREEKIKRLLFLVASIHADPKQPSYSKCEKMPCSWCKRALELYPDLLTKEKP